MTVARSAAEVLAEHVTLEVECSDRMYLNVYVPKLQYVGGVVSFLRKHRGNPFASSALMNPISRAFVGPLHAFADDQGVPMVDFAKGQRKDDVDRDYLAASKEPTGFCLSAGPGEGAGVPDREAPQPRHGEDLSMGRPVHGHGQPLLYLRRR